MDLIVITRQESLNDEVQIIKKLFDNGLQLLLLNKPTIIQQFIDQFEIVYQRKILPYNQKHTFHSIEEVEKLDTKIQFGFLSPIFDSISKPGYNSKFTEVELKEFFKKGNYKMKIEKIYALGGIRPNLIEKSKEIGFDGIGVVGGIWNAPDPVKAFLEYKDVCLKFRKKF